MKRFLDIIIFLGLIALLGIANQGLLGIKSAQEQEDFNFKPELGVKQTLLSSELAPKVQGYGGAIPIAIGLDDEGTIKGIEFGKNSETPEFFNQVLDSGITKHWLNKNIQAAANAKVDAVSGATMSSEGIIKTINTSISAHLGHESEGSGMSLSQAEILKLCSISFIALLGLLSFVYPRKMARFKTAIAFCSILILGVWQGSMLSVAKISAWLLGGVPSVVEIPLLIIFLAAVLLPLFTGRNFYCYSICPFGATQDLISRSIKLNIKVKLYKWLGHVRIVMLLACFLLLIMGLGAHIADLEPFSAFKPEYAPISAIAIFITAIIISTFIPRAWCRFFCPCGAFLDLFKKTKKDTKHVAK